MTVRPGAHLRPTTEGFVVVAGLLAAAAVGIAVGVSPILGLAAFGGLTVLWLLSWGPRMVPVFHGALIVILIGYAFLGRGMAYVGVAPLFVGEMVLGLGLVAILVSLPTARWGPVHLAIAVFVGWGLLRTIPYIGTYGIDALRDGVAYGYAVFAVAVSLTVRREHLALLLDLYRRVIPFFVVWVPIAAIVATAFAASLPVVPGSDTPIVVFKGGDTGVHLGAIGAFILLGLGGTERRAIPDAVIWAFWLVAIGITGAVNRGGMVAASMMVAAFAFGRTTLRWGQLILVAVLLVAVVGLVDPQVDVGISRRLSFDQIVSNVLSVFGGGDRDPVLEGTKEWRLQWWNEIIGYTVDGPYFWSGKGFGINLADADGFQVNVDGSLRAPHNGHMEILARGGVPLFGLWVLLQAVFGVTMLRAARRARAAGQTLWVGIVGWIVVYWLASLVNASFDVYLQGPMGGIWYWSMLGLGIAVARIIHDDVAPDEAPRRAPGAPFSAGAAGSGRSPG